MGMQEEEVDGLGDTIVTDDPVFGDKAQLEML